MTPSRRYQERNQSTARGSNAEDSGKQQYGVDITFSAMAQRKGENTLRLGQRLQSLFKRERVSCSVLTGNMFIVAIGAGYKTNPVSKI